MQAVTCAGRRPPREADHQRLVHGMPVSPACVLTFEVGSLTPCPALPDSRPRFRRSRYACSGCPSLVCKLAPAALGCCMPLCRKLPTWSKGLVVAYRDVTLRRAAIGSKAVEFMLLVEQINTAVDTLVHASAKVRAACDHVRRPKELLISMFLNACVNLAVLSVLDRALRLCTQINETGIRQHLNMTSCNRI